jgi:dTMP kinase
LFAAARDDHVRSTILPALEAGQWVICDRFIDSTRVYQGVLGQVDDKLIRGLERVTVGATMPDLTFILDVPASVGLARAKHRRGTGAADRFEGESVEYHEKLRQAFLALAESEPKRCVVIDGRAPREVVAERIWTAVEQHLHPGLERLAAEIAAP